MPEGLPHIPEEAIDPQAVGRERGHIEREGARELGDRLRSYWGGDTHAHSAESSRWGYVEGIYDEAEMARYYEGLGTEIVAFSEHTSKPGQPELLSADHPISKAFLAQVERIELLNQQPERRIAAFASAETNILFDTDGVPKIDLPDEVINRLDMVTASRHAISNEKDVGAIRTSLLAAINHPQVDIIGHPDRYIRLDQGVTENGEPCPPEAYWAAWDEVLDHLVLQKKAFEINFNNPPADGLLQRAADKGAQFVLSFDAHDFRQYRSELASGDAPKNAWASGQAQEEDLNRLRRYKSERLRDGPGIRAILRLAHTVERLDELGVTPDRIVNSSRERLLTFLADRGKNTANLQHLKEKFRE